MKEDKSLSRRFLEGMVTGSGFAVGYFLISLGLLTGLIIKLKMGGVI
jgi:hypothetical protein